MNNTGLSGLSSYTGSDFLFAKQKPVGMGVFPGE